MGLPCLSTPFWQATGVQNFRTSTETISSSLDITSHGIKDHAFFQPKMDSFFFSNFSMNKIVLILNEDAAQHVSV